MTVVYCHSLTWKIAQNEVEIDDLLQAFPMNVLVANLDRLRYETSICLNSIVDLTFSKQVFT